MPNMEKCSGLPVEKINPNPKPNRRPKKIETAGVNVSVKFLGPSEDAQAGQDASDLAKRHRVWPSPLQGASTKLV